MPLPAAELYSFGAEVNALNMTELCGGVSLPVQCYTCVTFTHSHGGSLALA